MPPDDAQDRERFGRFNSGTYFKTPQLLVGLGGFFLARLAALGAPFCTTTIAMACTDSQRATPLIRPNSGMHEALAVTPSLESILESFQKQGNGDTALLREILTAKRAEDQVGSHRSNSQLVLTRWQLALGGLESDFCGPPSTTPPGAPLLQR
jgi:hypothetical protein